MSKNIALLWLNIQINPIIEKNGFFYELWYSDILLQGLGDSAIDQWYKYKIQNTKYKNTKYQNQQN